MLPVPKQPEETLIDLLKEFRRSGQATSLLMKKRELDIINDVGCQHVAALEGANRDNERGLRSLHQRTMAGIVSDIADFCAEGKEYDPMQQKLDDLDYKRIAGSIYLKELDLKERISQAEALSKLQINKDATATNALHLPSR